MIQRREMLPLTKKILTIFSVIFICLSVVVGVFIFGKMLIDGGHVVLGSVIIIAVISLFWAVLITAMERDR